MESYFIEKMIDGEQYSDLVALYRKLKREDSPHTVVLNSIISSAHLIKEQEHKSNTLVFDLDGTVCKMSENLLGIGRVFPKVKIIIAKLQSMGYRVGILTARPNKDKEKIFAYLSSNGVKVDFVNKDPRESYFSYKPMASIYVDDRAFRFSGNWDQDEKNLFSYIKAIGGLE